MEGMLQVSRFICKQGIVVLLISLLWVGMVSGLKAQEIALKADLLPWITTTVNMGAEITLAPKWSAEMNLFYKPWSMLKDNRKMKGILVRPEVKYWFCQSL